MEQSEIRREVHRARRDFETGRVAADLLVRLYGVYNPLVPELGRFIASARELFPNLNCGVASVYLQFLLRSGQVVTGAYEGRLHSFLLCQNDLVADITADQFGGPAVYVGALRLPWSVPG